MSGNKGWRTPDVIRDGLVLYLDAGTSNSYNRFTNTTLWKDLTNNGNNCTLVNGPTLGTERGGCIVSDGVNDVATTNYFLPLSTFTINIVFKRNTANTWNPLWSSEIYNNGSGYFAYLSSITTLFFGKPAFGLSATVSNTDRINYYSFTVSNNGLLQFYYNGIFSTQTTITLPTNVEKPLIFFGRYANNGVGYTDLQSNNIYLTKVYNRVLSATEILQNYNAIRGRFGL